MQITEKQKTTCAGYASQVVENQLRGVHQKNVRLLLFFAFEIEPGFCHIGKREDGIPVSDLIKLISCRRFGVKYGVKIFGFK